MEDVIFSFENTYNTKIVWIDEQIGMSVQCPLPVPPVPPCLLCPYCPAILRTAPMKPRFSQTTFEWPAIIVATKCMPKKVARTRWLDSAVVFINGEQNYS